MSNYENIIRENAQKYYETGTQKLSDDVFDALVDAERKENPQSEVVSTTGWGYSIPNDKRKIKHKYGIVDSLDKVRTWDEIVNKLHLDKNYKPGFYFDVSAKIDGLSAILYYEENILTLALTRGKDGYGIDITEKVKYILGTDAIYCEKPFTGAVRGELTMPVKEFEQYKINHPKAENSRNSTAGLINGDEITEDYKYIKFCAYSIVGDESLVVLQTPIPYDRLSFIRIWLSQYFECTAPYDVIGLNENNYEDSLKSYKEDWSEEFYIDGVVISNQDVVMNNNNAVIQDSVAFKFQPAIAITEVLDIEWTMSKNACAIPVLLVKPVRLADTTVKRVTAYNANYVQENNLGKGAIIAICKSGEIIPKVVEVVKSAEFPDLPITCGYCGQMFMWDENHVNLVCVNEHCSQKENEQLKAICMNLAPVDGLGWKTINKCMNDMFYEYHDYRFNTIEDILDAEEIPGVTNGHGERGLFNYMLSILQRGTFTVSQFLLALNIPGLGKIGAKRWEESQNAIELLNYIVNTNEINMFDQNCVDLANIIQDKNVVKSFYSVEYHNRFKTYYNLLKDRIVSNIIVVNEIKEDKGNVCITGTLSIKRADFIKLLEQHGWKFVDHVYSDVKYLITNTPESNTSKNKKADELGVTKITEADFIANCL